MVRTIPLDEDVKLSEIPTHNQIHLAHTSRRLHFLIPMSAIYLQEYGGVTLQT